MTVEETPSNLDIILQAAEKTLAETGETEAPTDPAAQANLIHDVIASLGVRSPDIFQMIQDIIANPSAIVGGPGGNAPPEVECETPDGKVTFPRPNPIGKALPGLGAPNLEELFGAKVNDPIDKFFINLMATVASIFSTFFQLGSIQSRELLDQFEATRQTQLLSPAELADMVERNILKEHDAAKEAAGAGLNAERFHNLVLDTGEPPGIVEMLALYRRGLITEARLFQAVAYSRVRTEYFCDILNLAHETMSGADAIESYIKGVPVDDATFTTNGLTPPAGADAVEMRNAFFKKMFERAGGLPSQWDVLKTGAGDAIGVQRAAALEAHGLITHDEFVTIINRSRINPIFNYAAELGNAKWFATFQIGKMLSTGGATPAQGTQWLLQDGYPADQVAAFVAAYSGEKTLKAKQETESQLMVAYEAGLIDQSQLETGLKALGYHDASLPAIEQTITARRKLQAELSAITKIRTSYLARHITLAQVHSELMQLGVQPAVIKDYLHIWPIERGSQVKEVTPSQIGSLVHQGRIGKAEALSHWEAMGYSADQAELVYLHYAPTAESLKRGAIANGAPP